MVRTILAGIAFVLLATAALAQPRDGVHLAIAELRQAETLANSSQAFFQRDNNDGATAEQRSDSFRKLRSAIGLFARVAPKPIVGAALNGARAFLRGPSPLPQTLIEVVEECERRNDTQLTQRVLSRVTSAISAARDDLEAEAKFGEIHDNPTFYDAVTLPTNGLGLLRNLAFALDHDVVLRRDFYAVENLHRFLGVHPTVYRTPDGGIWARWLVKPTGAEKVALEPGAERYAQCQYSVGLNVADSGKKGGGIGIVCNFRSSIGPSFDEVERVFGPDWQDTWQAPAHSPPVPRTAPHGNTRMTYDFDKGVLRRSVEASFEADGIFSSFALKAEER